MVTPIVQGNTAESMHALILNACLLNSLQISVPKHSFKLNQITLENELVGILLIKEFSSISAKIVMLLRLNCDL